MTGNPTFQVDPAGDLNLLVKHHGQDEIFQVSSKVMSLASPVWRTMLDPDGPFRESKPDDGEVAFPDDQAEAMLIILLAAHLRNQEVPQTIVYEQLLNICVLCDKYDCIGVVRPWISTWEAMLKPLAYNAGHEEWLFIAWTIGDEETFGRLICRLANDAMTDGSGHYLTASGVELGHNMPPGFVVTQKNYSGNSSYYTHSSVNNSYHDQCGFKAELKTEIEKILAAMPLSTRESDRNHIVTQRQKLGQTDMLLSRLQKPGPV